MKITIFDTHYDYPPGGKTIEFEDTFKVADDWDYLFDSLREYRDHLELRTKREDSLGKQIHFKAKVDRLNELFKKYQTFIEMAEAWRHEM